MALLTDEGDIYTGATRHTVARTRRGRERTVPLGGHSGSGARARSRRGGDPGGCGGGPVTARPIPCRPASATYERLVGLDPELPLVLKQHGRWVMLPANKVTPTS